MSEDDETVQDTLEGAYGFAMRPKPRLWREVVVRQPVEGGIAGFICGDKERPDVSMVYATLRHPTTHMYHKERAWAISNEILDTLRKRGVSRIIVHLGTGEDDSPIQVTGTGDVYEFTARQYYEDGVPVPDADVEHAEDPQTYVPDGADEAMHHWEDYAGDLFVQPFGKALDRISEKRGW